MSGYTRQQSYIDGDVILAEHTNDEFDLLEEVFSTNLGHKHDGTVAEGPTIDRILDDDGDTGIEVERVVDVDTIVFKTVNLDRMKIDSVGAITHSGNSIFNGVVDINNTLTVDGVTTFSTRPAFNGGTSGVDSPFTVDSTVKVANLNAELLDNADSTQYLRSDVADQVDGILTYTAIPAFNGGTSGVSAPFTVDSTFLVTNLNSDLLDGQHGSYYAGISESETITGSWSYATNPILQNNIFLRGLTTGAAQRNLLGVSSGDQITIGDAALPVRINNNGTFSSNGSTIWHAGNDGAGSGLDADLLDGVQGSDYARLSTSNVFSGGDISLAAVGGQFVAHVGDSATAPGFTWGGQQATTGMFLVGNNILGFSTSGVERMRIDANGGVGIHTDVAQFDVTTSSSEGRYFFGNEFSLSRESSVIAVYNRTGTDGAAVNFRKAGVTVGSISVTASATAYNTTSDYRLKENVIDLTSATSRLKDLQPKRFNFIGQEMTIDGFIAHEVQSVVPEAVTGEKDGEEFQQMDASKLIPLLVATIKELEERISTLEGNL